MENLRASFDRERPDFPAGTPFWTDTSFTRGVARWPGLAAVAHYLNDETKSGELAADQLASATVPSSYRDHRYDTLFRALVRALRPKRCVELGVLHGFSLLAVASALRENGEGRIEGFDLFEDYPYTHARQDAVLERVRAAGLDSWAVAHRVDAVEVAARFDAVDYLHVDLSNDGDIFRRVFDQWAHKVTSLIVLEGGSPARDGVEWMLRYRKAPIAAALQEIQWAYPEWSFAVLDPYPSLTIALRTGGLASSRTMRPAAQT